MLRTYLYLPEEINKKVSKTAKTLKKSKAAVLRLAIEKGLYSVQEEKLFSAQALLKVAELGKKYKVAGPKDSSEKMDDYLWPIKNGKK